jgi:GNAT superfamily N-acetyltransferase
MTDLLVKLYTLPPLEPELSQLDNQGVIVRRAIAPEKHLVLAWIQEHFNTHWVSECDVAFHHMPASCWIAIEKEQLIGFACYESTCKNFFGPMGVLEIAQGRGVGKALLLGCLHDMRVQGYAYAIIGGVGPAEFYHKTVGAVTIADSTPGIYGGMLRK